MSWALHVGDVRTELRHLEAESVHTVVTSPPYWQLRDYGAEGQIGLEDTPEAFVAELVAVFGEVWRVLRADGTLWLNLGDTYVGGRSEINPEYAAMGAEVLRRQVEAAGGLSADADLPEGRSYQLGLFAAGGAR